MEKFFLCGLFAGYKLNIVYQQEIYFSEFLSEFLHFSVLKRIYQTVRKIFAFDISNDFFRILFMYCLTDCKKKMCFSKAGISVNEKGIVILPARML